MPLGGVEESSMNQCSHTRSTRTRLSLTCRRLQGLRARDDGGDVLRHPRRRSVRPERPPLDEHRPQRRPRTTYCILTPMLIFKLSLNKGFQRTSSLIQKQLLYQLTLLVILVCLRFSSTYPYMYVVRMIRCTVTQQENPLQSYIVQYFLIF